MRRPVKWHMTDEELKRSWKNAEDTVAQIGIIAELNNATKDEVIQKLRELGEDLPDLKTVRRGKALSEADLRKIWKLREEGIPYYKIARMLGGITAEQTLKKKHGQLREEYREALPLIKKALNAHLATGTCDEREAVTIITFIRRYL